MKVTGEWRGWLLLLLTLDTSGQVSVTVSETQQQQEHPWSERGKVVCLQLTERVRGFVRLHCENCSALYWSMTYPRVRANHRHLPALSPSHGQWLLGRRC